MNIIPVVYSNHIPHCILTCEYKRMTQDYLSVILICMLVVHNDKVLHENGVCPYPTAKNHIFVLSILKDYHNNNTSLPVLCLWNRQVAVVNHRNTVTIWYTKILKTL